MTIDWQPLLELIANHKSFVLTTHCRADCDAVGSELALAQILESLGKQVTISNGDAVPEHIGFINPNKRVRVLGESIKPAELWEIDALIVVDTSVWVQLGPMAEVVRMFPGTRVVIDHHIGQDDLGAEVFKDDTAEATGRLILDLAEALGVEITPEIAMPLFAAIATDTGWFRFSSVTEKTFQALAKLVAAGADPPGIFSALFERHSLARLYLRGRILSNVVPAIDGRLMSTHVTCQDFDETGAEKTDTEDVINLLHTVAGCEVAVLFVELEDQVTKVSLRSRTDFDVRAIAEQFGGGGHRAAAGVAFQGSLEDAQQAILDALSIAMTPSGKS
ncbi:MAG: bifunctional oligoribonuclease/PAP phosphatase NrnA [Planctomycetes bacterium]|nr:bifunctional oligoribonuclease/PAP phosphatase NrnA [Planctomycetota bacterium]